MLCTATYRAELLKSLQNPCSRAAWCLRPLQCQASKLRAVCKRAPGLAKLATSIYSKHSELLVRGAAAGSPRIQSQTGVSQGDPVGGLYFGLTLQDVLQTLQTLQELFPELRLIVYADDVCLHGSGEQVFAAYKELV